jgi:hypothetical protein
LAAISLDTIVASAIVLTIFVLGTGMYHDILSAEAENQRYVSCLSEALVYGDVVMKDIGGPLNAHCSLLPVAAAKIKTAGFSGEISCDTKPSGDYSIVLTRYVYDQDTKKVRKLFIAACSEGS